MIDKNNIPQGYKNSPIGIIPQEWEVKKIQDICNVDSKSLSSKTPMDYEFEYISLSDVDSDSFEISTSHQIFRTAPSRARRIVTKGDVVVSTVRPNLKGFFIVKEDKKDLIASTGFAVLTPKESNSEYLLSCFFSQIIGKQFYSLVVGSSYPAVNSSDVARLKLPLPPLAEQKKIAEILCTWDDAIEKQSKLIEKLELRKRGLMQRLLTGKTRLPGFAEPWKQVKLGEIGKISSAGVDKKVNDNELPVRLLNFVDVFYRDFIYDSEITYWVTAKHIKAEQCSVQKGDIFFTPSSEKQTDIALSAVAMDDMSRVVYSYHIVRLRPHIEMDLHYRAYAFKTDEFYKQAERICDGSGQRYVISQDGFRNMVVHLPSLAEQKAIAEVLTSADKEITIQRKKLVSLRLQKRGLMQQLLTGKTRVRI